MTADANPNPEPLTRADRNVREILAVCAKHNIPCGEPENLAGFMRMLYDDKYFAMDFWKLLARLEKNGREAIGADWLLAIVVEGVAGRTVAAARAASPAEAALVGKLARVLAGQDEFQDEFQRTESRLPPEPVSESTRASMREERPRLRLDPEPSAAFPSVASAVNPTPPEAPAPEVQLHEAAADWAPADRAPEGRSPNEPQIVIPLAAYADREHQGRAVSAGVLVAVILVLSVAAGGFWLGYHPDSAQSKKLTASLRSGYASADSIWKRAVAHRPSGEVPRVAAPATSANPLAAPEQLPALPQNSAPATRSESAPADAVPEPTAQGNSMQDEPPQNVPPQREPAQVVPPEPAPDNAPRSESAQGTSAQGKPVQSAAASPSHAKPRHFIDPVVLQAARESQQH